MKKHALILGIAFGAVSLNALASSTATLSWTGQVGSGIAHGDYMITGHNGSTTADAFRGDLISVESNAKFASNHIVLELRENTGSASAPVPGDKWGIGSELNGTAVTAINITWSVEHVAGTIGSGVDIASLNGGNNPIIVTINGTPVDEKASWTTTSQNEVGIRVKNDTPLNPSEVAGKDISIEVGISATAA
ncbi:hypothetical protein AB4154_11820 [Vibrio sp. 10N.286.51.B11]|jgi:hypothetical protein|uniref:hypothetical protein n=1 Tax=Vibrio TaxID=662 RepID=UPI0010BD86B4|nr:hypothetical protein [Vibrio sp. F13]TKG02864.1 hypothetical protein FCV76_07185 [Vibrio sp. F13]